MPPSGGSVGTSTGVVRWHVAGGAVRRTLVIPYGIVVEPLEHDEVSEDGELASPQQICYIRARACLAIARYHGDCERQARQQ